MGGIVTATGVDVINHKLLMSKNFQQKQRSNVWNGFKTYLMGREKNSLCDSVLHHVSFGLVAPLWVFQRKICPCEHLFLRKSMYLPHFLAKKWPRGNAKRLNIAVSLNKKPDQDSIICDFSTKKDNGNIQISPRGGKCYDLCKPTLIWREEGRKSDGAVGLW